MVLYLIIINARLNIPLTDDCLQLKSTAQRKDKIYFDEKLRPKVRL